MKSKSNLRKVSIGSRVFDYFNYCFMIVFCITIIYPLWNLILLSFSTVSESQKLGIHIWNNTWVLDAYRYVFSQDVIISAYMNSIFRTAGATILVVITSLIGAYPLSKKELPGRNFITILFLIPMFFSGGLVPYYFLIKGLGLMDSVWVYVIPNMVGLFNILMVRNYLMSLDKALEESAFIDGAGYVTILFKIIMPLSKPVLATIALWTIVGQWNAWFDSLIFISDDRKIVLQLVIQRMLRAMIDFGRDLEAFRHLTTGGAKVEIFANNVRAATILITIGPIIFTYPFMQRYFIKGIMIGSLKG